MGEIAEALKKLIEDSEDLSILPQLVAKVEELENSEAIYQERISRLQEVNRNLLAQIPIPGAEPDTDEEEEKQPTLEDAKQYLIEALGGNR